MCLALLSGCNANETGISELPEISANIKKQLTFHARKTKIAFHRGTRRNMKFRATDSPWTYASLAFALLAIVALVLIRGSGPLIPGAGMPSSSHWLWLLPGWLAIASLAAVLLGLPAAAVCAIVAYRQRATRLLSGASVWTGCFFVAILLVLFIA